MRVVESFKVDDDDRGIAAVTLKLPASGDSVTVTWQLVDNTQTVSLEACSEFVEMPLRHGNNRAWYVTTFASISCLGLVRSRRYGPSSPTRCRPGSIGRRASPHSSPARGSPWRRPGSRQR